MDRFPYRLLQKIRENLQKAEEAMWDRAFELDYPDASRKPGDACYLNPGAVLQSNLEKAFGDLRMLAEAMEQVDCLERIKNYDLKEHRSFASVLFDHEAEASHCPAIDQAKSYLDSLVAMRFDGATTDSQPFENILRNTAKIVLNAGGDPKKETNIKDPVFKVLKVAYPDTLRKQPIPHPIKSYIPDFASKAAQAVAEYKFASDHDTLMVACDHLAKSMHGYSGDDTWAEKFGVIYLTSPFASQVDADAHFKSIGKPDDWRIILLVG